MRNTLLIAFSVVLCSIPGLSAPGGAAPLDFVAFLNQPDTGGSCGQGESGAKGVVGSKAICSASCGMHGTSTCNYATSCSAVDRHCPRRGSVTCDGVTTLCPVCTTADYCYQCNQDPNDCVSCCVCAGDTVAFCRDAC